MCERTMLQFKISTQNIAAVFVRKSLIHPRASDDEENCFLFLIRRRREFHMQKSKNEALDKILRIQITDRALPIEPYRFR